MRKGFLILSLAAISCVKQQAHPPVGGVLSDKDLTVSKNRAKILNELERNQIESWIDNQSEKFFPMGLNYWTNIENLKQKTKKKNGEPVSYSYEIYDFDMVKLYQKPFGRHQGTLGKFEELKAVDDAIRYMRPGEEATLLVPSVLAFGTYGDNDKISNDIPLIIKLKMLNP